MRVSRKRMRLLFIKPKHIGDTLLLTPTLKAARAVHPNAEIWVLIREGCENILSGCPDIDHIVVTGSSKIEDVKTILKFRKQNFDYAFELSGSDRGRTFCLLSGAQTKCTNETVRLLPRFWSNRFDVKSSFNWEFRHAVEKDYYTVSAALQLNEPIPPLVFDPELTKECEFSNLENFAIIHPSTRWKRKRWPVDNWAKLGRELLTRFDHLVVSCGPDKDERAQAAHLANILGTNVHSTNGEIHWNQLAGLMYKAKIFIGVDTAAMHLSSACQCPLVAIFCDKNNDPWVCQWTPWKSNHRIAKAYGDETVSQVINLVENLTG